MKMALATWYMEKAWLKMGPARDIKVLHKLFSMAYSVRIRAYLAEVR